MLMAMTDKDKARFWAKVDVRGPDECWPWLAGISGGYGDFWLCSGHIGAHRVAMALDGRDPGELLACHTCDNPPCCNPAHLFAGTIQDNYADCVSKGRQARGERHGSKTKPERVARGERNGAYTKPECVPRGGRHGSRTKPESRLRGDAHPSRKRPECLARGERSGTAKLTEVDVSAIRLDTRTNIAIAADYGIDKTNVSLIKLRKTWKHVA